MNNYIIDIAVRSVALTVFFVAPVYGLKISEDFNLQIIKTLQLINSKTFKF